ncbi:MAG: tetratricopeptide repeat protein, partial [Candidatus Eremiobacteraeota bacterium]|nr:tetratricopeptide repeat protein [Candidatus Eremiobacteraeota bacterium]
WTGELDPKRLGDFVADARAAKNYALDTADQTLVDRLLDPAAYDLGTSADQYAAVAARIKATVTVVEAFAGAHSSGKDATVDYTRTLAEEGALQMVGAQRAMTLATTPEQHVAADRLLAGADAKLNRFGDAIAALKDAQTIAPADATLDLDIARADYRLHDYDGGIAAAKAYTAAVPGDSDGWDFLGLLDQRAGKFVDAAPAYQKTSALLKTKVGAAKSPADKQDAIANVADDALDLANVYLALGDVTNTQRTFALANEYGNQLDPHGIYADLYNNVHERTQEGLIAVRLAHGRKTALSVVPWTGPDLPGSVASTLKYRLIVASAPNGKLDLRTIGLRPGWVASFCADGLCSPNRVSFALPDSGVKTYEFQLVPPGASHVAGKVTVVTSDGITALVPARG